MCRRLYLVRFQLLHQLGVHFHQHLLGLWVKVQNKFFKDGVLVLTAAITKCFVVCSLPFL